MSNENNKIQIDIENLFKQNVNDLSAIKELYRKLKEVEEKISQIKYIDSALAYKLKKEYEKLKRIILDENASAKLANDIESINTKLTNDIESINTKLTNDIESINTKLTNDIEPINTKLTNDIETINSQLDTIAKDKEFIKLSLFGNSFDAFKSAIQSCKTNNQNLLIDIDLNLVNTATINIDFDLEIKGKNVKLKFDNNLFLVTKKLKISNITFDLENEGFFKVAEVLKNSQLVCNDCSFLNFKNTTPKSCIIFDIENGSFTIFENLIINNIKSIGDGNITDGNGEQRFIRTKSNSDKTDINGYTIIKNITVDNFYNINSNNEVILEDSDIFSFQHGNKLYHNATIENVSCKNIGKRLIKAQSSNIRAININIDNTNYNSPVHVCSAQNSSNITIEDVTIRGNNCFILESFGDLSRNITVKNIDIDSVSGGSKSECIFSIQSNDIYIENVKGKASSFINLYKKCENIFVNNVKLKIDKIGVVISELINDLSINNINFNYVELVSDNISDTICFNTSSGYKVGNLALNNCNFNYTTSYEHGSFNFVDNSNTIINNCNFKSNKTSFVCSGSNIELLNTKIDELNSNGWTTIMYIINSYIDIINITKAENTIYIANLKKQPTINYYSQSTSECLKKYYNID